MFPGNRVGEFHVVGVQSLTCHVLHVWVVQVVTNQWITEIFHMNTDLVGAAGLKTKRDKAVPICFFYHFIMGDCIFSMFPVYGPSDCLTIRKFSLMYGIFIFDFFNTIFIFVFHMNYMRSSPCYITLPSNFVTNSSVENMLNNRLKL